MKLAPHRPRIARKKKPRQSSAGFMAAEFFSGIGLVSLALEQEGWEISFANDIDADKAEIYGHNWPKDGHLVVGDIHKLDAKVLPHVDLFTASFPCNDLSIAG